MGFDASGLEDLRERFEQASLDVPTAMKQLLVRNAEYCLTLTRRNSPVQDGELRKSWERSEPQEVLSGEYEVEVYSSELAPHALWVEEGHAQHKRWVPGRWEGDRFVYDPEAETGMMLEEKFIPGQWMARTALVSTQEKAPEMLEAASNQILMKAVG